MITGRIFPSIFVRKYFDLGSFDIALENIGRRQFFSQPIQRERDDRLFPYVATICDCPYPTRAFQETRLRA